MGDKLLKAWHKRGSLLQNITENGVIGKQRDRQLRRHFRPQQHTLLFKDAMPQVCSKLYPFPVRVWE